MGQKVHPIGFRLGINKLWESSWFNLKKMPLFIAEDAKIRKFIKDRVGNADISKINIERMGEMLRITIHAGKPGVVIGKGGAEVENLKSEIDDMTGLMSTLNVEHIKRSGIDAYLIAKNIAVALEKKMKFRNIMKRAISRTITEGVKGIKISVSGRLNGAEIARTEWMKEGRVPLQTIRADIDYGFCEALTTYGNIGVKVWVYHGEILTKRENNVETK